MNFKICDDVSALGIKVAFLLIYGIENDTHDENIRGKIESFYTQLLNDHMLESFENDPNLAGYRKLHEAIDVTDKALVASPESLIKILYKHKSLRPINFLVDIYNYIAIKNKISIGAHDIKHISGNVRLCFTNGDEQFVPLGKNKPQQIKKGEYCYIDDDNEILCRLDCRQCDKTKTTPNTKDCLFIIQGHSDIAVDTIQSTAEEIQSIFSAYTSNENADCLRIL